MFGRKKRLIVRILLVEDEPLVAFDNEHFLQSEGFDIVATVDSVAEAVRTIETDSDIHLVLADIGLSDGSGIDVARAAHSRGIPVVFVTGSCPGNVEALAAGCLSKPYTQRDLIGAIDAIDGVLAGRKPPRKLPASFTLFAQTA